MELSKPNISVGKIRDVVYMACVHTDTYTLTHTRTRTHKVFTSIISFVQALSSMGIRAQVCLKSLKILFGLEPGPNKSFIESVSE